MSFPASCHVTRVSSNGLIAIDGAFAALVIDRALILTDHGSVISQSGFESHEYAKSAAERVAILSVTKERSPTECRRWIESNEPAGYQGQLAEVEFHVDIHSFVDS